jgi:hypothetical protein
VFGAFDELSMTAASPYRFPNVGKGLNKCDFELEAKAGGRRKGAAIKDRNRGNAARLN